MKNNKKQKEEVFIIDKIKLERNEWYFYQIGI
jgi:hypothetical protein